MAGSPGVASKVAIATGAGTFDGLAAGPVSGRGVLLLHGFPEDSGQWLGQLPALAAAGFRAVAFDQRGYSSGVRPVEVDAYGPEDLIGDVLAVADALGWSRFDLVGHDWGSAVGWMTAAAFPERLRTLTAISTPHGAALGGARRSDEDQRRRTEYFGSFQRAGDAERELLLEGGLRRIYAGLPEERVEHYLRRFSSPGALTAALNWYRAMRPPAVRGPVSVPTMYVWSTGDEFIGPVAARAAERFVTAPYRFEVLDGVSHWFSEVAPERLAALIVGWLGEW